MTKSPLQIKWAAFIPDSGIVTKKDQLLMGSIITHRGLKENYVFGSKATKEAIESLRGKLAKSYTVYFFTDLQFGKLKSSQSIIAILTTMQKNAAFKIK